MSSKYDVFIPTIRLLHGQKLTDTEIAECVGIDSRRVYEIRRKFGLIKNNPSEIPLTLSELQKQIIIGGIIGDMCIFKDKGRGTYHRMNLAHSLKQKQYLLLKAHLLGDLFSDPKERSWVDQRTKKEYHEIRIQSRTHKMFSVLYNKWYRNGKKIIHDDVWRLNEIGLSVIYFDDGWKTNSGFQIAMDDYDLEDIQKFAKVLEDKFNLACTVPPLNRSVYIKSESEELFRKIVKPFVTVGMEHKL